MKKSEQDVLLIAPRCYSWSCNILQPILDDFNGFINMDECSSSPTTSSTTASVVDPGTRHWYVPASESLTLESFSERSPHFSLLVDSDVLPAYDGCCSSRRSPLSRLKWTNLGSRSGRVHSTVKSRGFLEESSWQGKMMSSPIIATIGWGEPDAWDWPKEEKNTRLISSSSHKSALITVWRCDTVLNSWSNPWWPEAEIARLQAHWISRPALRLWSQSLDHLLCVYTFL